MGKSNKPAPVEDVNLSEEELIVDQVPTEETTSAMEEQDASIESIPSQSVQLNEAPVVREDPGVKTRAYRG